MDAFTWPSSNIFSSTLPEISGEYYDNVRAYVNANYAAIPSVLAAYNEENAQRHIFLPSIERSQRHGLALTVLNAPLPCYDESAVAKIITDLRAKIMHASSINVAVGFMHSSQLSHSAKFKYASNNTMLLNEHLTVLNRKTDLERLKALIAPQKVFEKVEQDFVQSYRINVVDMFQVSIQIWHSQHPVGCANRDALKMARAKKHGLVTFGHISATDNLCFWRCLAYHIGGKSKINRLRFLDRMARRYQAQAVAAQLMTSNKATIDVARNTCELEHLFGVNMLFYDKTGSLYDFPYTTRIYTTTMRILLIEKHCMYIKSLNALFGRFSCPACNKFYSTRQSLCQHVCVKKDQQHVKKVRFCGGIEQPEHGLFDYLTAMNVHVPETLRYNNGFAAFDIECLLQAPDADVFEERNLGNIVEEHVPCSIAVAYSGNADSIVWLLSNGDSQALVKQFVDALKQMHDAHVQKQLVAYEPILRQFEDVVAVAGQPTYPFQDKKSILALCKKPKYRTEITQRLRQQLYSFVFKLPVLGYNSSSYDLNVLKEWLFPILAKTSHLSILKRRSRYLCIETEEFKFLDAYLFVAAGTSLKAFMKSHLAVNVKLEFPYRYLSSLQVLSETALPPVEHWLEDSKKYDAATDANKAQMIAKAQERLNLAQEFWIEHGLQTFGDYLRQYNIADVQPFITAFQAFATLFAQKRINVFQHITLPSVAKEYGVRSSPPGSYFVRFAKRDEHVYNKIRNNLYGGVSLVWNRFVKCGETLIRPYTAQHPHVAHSILGMDMSGCYLYASSEEHMTGPYFERLATNNFKIQNNFRDLNSILALEYAVYVKYGQAGLDRLQHKWKGGEKRFITSRATRYSGDGYLELNSRKIIMEYNGCYFHNHKCNYCKHENPKYDADKEQERYNVLCTLADEIHIIWECDWYQTRRAHDCHAFIQTRPLYKTWSSRFGMTQKSVITSIMQNHLKGLIEIDAYVPKNLLHMYQDLNPFFYRTAVNWSMIGTTMQDLMERQNRKFESREMLLNPPYCEKLLLTHQYVKYLIEHGIEIVKIHSVFEFPYASYPFKELASEISARRQEAADDPSKEAEGLQQKLIGNALYGTFITNASEFTTTIITNAQRAEKMLFQAPVQALIQLTDDLYEVTVLKKTIVIKQPVQFGMVVYCLSKLRVLTFTMEWFRLLEREKFALVLADTDSIYTCFAHEAWEACCKPDIGAKEIDAFKRRWFALERCQSKQAGLWHVEFSGSLVIALAPKLYIAISRDGTSTKLATRGMPARHNTFTAEMFQAQLFENTNNQQKVVAQSFRMMNDKMVTLRTLPSSFVACYIKRQVLPDLRNTIELKWNLPAWANI